MMGTTVHGLPYPEPTDPVANGAADIRALAEAVDTDIATFAKFVTWGGRDVVTTGADGAFAIPIRIPAGYDLIMPAAVTMICANPAYGIWLTLGDVTSTYFDGRAYTVTAGAAAAVASIAFPIVWMAVAQRTGTIGQNERADR